MEEGEGRMEGDTVNVGTDAVGGGVRLARAESVEEGEVVKVAPPPDAVTAEDIEGTLVPVPPPPIDGVDSKFKEGEGTLVMVPPPPPPACKGVRVGIGGVGESKEEGVTKEEPVPPLKG